jgi:hypothetical protein
MKKLSKLSAARTPISFVNKARLTAALLLIAAGLMLAALVVSSEAAPFIYVANTGEDTVSKIDVSVPAEVARYATWFSYPGTSAVAPHASGTGPCPSRIARDSAKNAYVLDRFFSDAGNKWHLPVLLKIDVSPGSPTSTGGSNVLAMTDGGVANNHIDPGEATDKAIAWATEIGTAGAMNPPMAPPTPPPLIPPIGGDDGALGRAVCVDPSGDLWVGLYNTFRYYKVKASTGAVIAGPISTIKGSTYHTPYGCQVDVNGKLWSVDSKYSLAEIDTRTNTLVDIYDHSCGTSPSGCGQNYSLSIFNDCSKTPIKVTVYLSERGYSKTYIAYDVQNNKFTNPGPPIPSFNSWSVAVDSQGNIFSGEFSTGRLIKASPTGAKLWDTGPLTSGPQYTSNLHGLIVDELDNVWVVDMANDRVLKYDTNGVFGPPVPVGKVPYTYGNTPPATCTGNTGGGTDDGGCAPVTGVPICLPNGDYSYNFTVTNNSGHAISQLLLTPVQGSTFTLTPQLATFPSPLPNGQSTTLTTTISGAKPGDKVCFYVSLLADKEACCNKQVCLTMPKCGEVSPTPTIMAAPLPTRQQRPPPPSRRGKRRP